MESAERFERTQISLLHDVLRIRVANAAAMELAKATIVFIVCDRGDRYLSTGVFPA